MGVEVMKTILTVVMVGVLSIVIGALDALYWKQKRLRRKLEKQGIRGPPTSRVIREALAPKKSPASYHIEDQHQPITHNFCTSIHLIDRWRQEYGSVFTFSMGGAQVLYIYDPEILREMCTATSLAFGRSSQYKRLLFPLLGHGVLTSNGPDWARQRKIISAEFFHEKVKGMINLMVESSMTLVRSWVEEIEKGGGVADINIVSDMRKFSADVIARACFRSNYEQGKEIFSKLRSLLTSITAKIHSSSFPGTEFLPTPSNRHLWRLEKEVRSLILQVVKESKEGASKDLLHTILESANKESEMGRDATDNFIVDNCKNIYLAGYEPTATTGSWTLLLLALYPEWQAKVREEVVRICGDQPPDAEMTRQMKVLTMVIQETLRIYANAPTVAREALQDMKFGNIRVPKGVHVWAPVQALHHDPEIWGPDAHIFKPERFINGVANACKISYAYMPFGLGPRLCLGQNFAMLELKVLISLIICRFSISVSPRYRHSPVWRLNIEPESGVELIFKKL